MMMAGPRPVEVQEQGQEEVEVEAPVRSKRASLSPPVPLRPLGFFPTNATAPLPPQPFTASQEMAGPTPTTTTRPSDTKMPPSLHQQKAQKSTTKPSKEDKVKAAKKDADEWEDAEIVLGTSDARAYTSQHDSLILEFAASGGGVKGHSTREGDEELTIFPDAPLSFLLTLPRGFPKMAKPKLTLLSPDAATHQHPLLAENATIVSQKLSEWTHETELSSVVREICEVFRAQPPIAKSIEIVWRLGAPPPRVGDVSQSVVEAEAKERLRGEKRTAIPANIVLPDMPEIPAKFPELETMSGDRLQKLCALSAHERTKSVEAMLYSHRVALDRVADAAKQKNMILEEVRQGKVRELEEAMQEVMKLQTEAIATQERVSEVQACIATVGTVCSFPPPPPPPPPPPGPPPPNNLSSPPIYIWVRFYDNTNMLHGTLSCCFPPH